MGIKVGLKLHIQANYGLTLDSKVIYKKYLRVMMANFCVHLLAKINYPNSENAQVHWSYLEFSGCVTCVHDLYPRFFSIGQLVTMYLFSHFVHCRQFLSPCSAAKCIRQVLETKLSASDGLNRRNPLIDVIITASPSFWCLEYSETELEKDTLDVTY